MFKKLKNIFLSLLVGSSLQANNPQKFTPASESYKTMNEKVQKDSMEAEHKPFALSFGTSESQTDQTTRNTNHPEEMRKSLAEAVVREPAKKRKQFLMERIETAKRALPNYQCTDCNKPFTPIKRLASEHTYLVEEMIKNLDPSNPQLQLSECMHCGGKLKETGSRELKSFGKKEQQQFIDQIKHLGVSEQAACKLHGAPNYRFSTEMASVLDDNGNIDPAKVKEKSEFLKKIGNPMVFFHHYANPASYPNLFESDEGIQKFSEYCHDVTKESGITHACPISQPVAFSMRVARNKDLAPFYSNLTQKQLLERIVQAQVAAAEAIKRANPDAKVLVSHQWKPFKESGGLAYPLEKLVTTIAHNMYNKAFVNAFKKHEDSFDGIALSIYPSMKFKGVTPENKNINCSGIIDYDGALEALREVHKAFPNKEIWVVETGCNTTSAERKQEFIDMTLQACKVARDEGIPVMGVYFWGHTNHPDFYSEWGSAPGTTNFAPFDDMNVESINAAGNYIKDIVRQ